MHDPTTSKGAQAIVDIFIKACNSATESERKAKIAKEISYGKINDIGYALNQGNDFAWLIANGFFSEKEIKGYVEYQWGSNREIANEKYAIINNEISKFGGQYEQYREAVNSNTVSESFQYLYDGLAGIPKGFYNGYVVRWDNVKNDPSFYTIGNWISSGVFDAVAGMYSEKQDRWDKLKENPTPETLANWLSDGGVDMLQAAFTVNPENPSAQWIASFQLTTLLFSIYHAAGGTSVLNPSGERRY